MKQFLNESIVTLPTLTGMDTSLAEAAEALDATRAYVERGNDRRKSNDRRSLSQRTINKLDNAAFVQGYEDGIKEGHQEGYIIGLTEGRSLGEEKIIKSNNEQESALEVKVVSNIKLESELKEKITMFEELIVEISKQKHEFAIKSKDVLLELIYESVCKLVSECISDKSCTQSAIVNFINAENTQLNYKLEVSKEDYNYLSEATDVIMNLPINFDVVASDKVLSGYIATSDVGSIDARTDMMLQNFRELLLSHKVNEGK